MTSNSQPLFVPDSGSWWDILLSDPDAMALERAMQEQSLAYWTKVADEKQRQREAEIADDE